MAGSSKERLEALRKLLEAGELSTQEELRDKLEKQDFDVTQSTISRDLRKLGAVRAVDNDGRTVYQLPHTEEPSVQTVGLEHLLRGIETNGSIIVIRTVIGSAPLIARHLDNVQPAGILGTIAGDDTIFVVPATNSAREVKATIKAITTCLSPSEDSEKN